MAPFGYKELWSYERMIILIFINSLVVDSHSLHQRQIAKNDGSDPTRDSTTHTVSLLS